MIGKTFSHFTITAKLGEGGMGEVYRAEDAKLGREVAIKVLPEMLTADPERLARFEREAKVLASLNHPNIAGIHQIEEADGQQLLVMEFVDGEELADRLKQGRIPVDEAVDIAQQVAQGLEAAHERGIVHRDLKPANLKLTPSGQVKILDFGLAKAHEAAEKTDPDQTRSPTLTAQMTQAGVILGTAAYMSPEQARGQEADPRADIWALGVVLYEMLTGERQFAEPTVSDTLAAVLRAEIDWETLPAATPRGLKRLLRRCLERDPKQRYHSAADVRIELEEALDEKEAAAPVAVAPPNRLPWIVAASTAAIALLLAVLLLRPAEEKVSAPGARMVSSVLPPPDADFALDRSGLSFSPDGTRLAFVARNADKVTAIWLRTLSRNTAEVIPDTEGALGPFWSPDGLSIGFTQDGELRILELDSGLVESLAPRFHSGGATWSLSGDIVFSDDDEDLALLAIDRTGGNLRPVTENPTGGDTFFGPDFLPDGEHFLFHSRRYGSDEQLGQIRLGSLDGSPSKHLFDTYSTARYVEPGFIVWWHMGNLRARAFDVQRLEFVGEPFAIASDVRFDPRSAFAVAAISTTGLLAYQTGGRVAGNQLVWYNRQGEVIGTVGEAGSLYSPRISPDGSQIALDISGDSNQGDIWVLDSERGSGQRVTVWPEDDSVPVWAADGQELMFVSSRGGGEFKTFRVNLEGAEEPELVLGDADSSATPRAWSRDGRTVLYLAGDTGDLWTLSLDTDEVQAVIESEFLIQGLALSPDETWVAYDSDDTGRREVYLASFPDTEQRVRVSTEGGSGPVWSGSGTELFFSSPESDAILAVEISIENGKPVLGRPEKLFEVDMKVHGLRQFDTIDGQRFLVNAEVNSGARIPLTLVLNWVDDQ